MKKVKKPKPYNFNQKPLKPNKLFMGVVKLVGGYPAMNRRKFECEYVNMEGIKPPYFLLANHASEMDFRMLYSAIRPNNANFVVAIDALHDNTKTALRWAGAICKRKFIHDFAMIRNMKYSVDHNKNILCLYPEARYSFDGTQSFLTPAVGKMAKLLKVPLVVLITYGNYICNQQWNKSRFRYAPVKAKLICVANAEEVKTLSAEELNRRVSEVFVYDDFKYQFDNKIKIDYKNRAHGLHHILYQCCECGTEFEMYSEGTTLECKHCGKKWEMTEYGRLEAHDKSTRFAHIPDWFKWERENVKAEIESGTYCIEDQIEVHTLPNQLRYYDHGTGWFRQDMTGTHFGCTCYGEPFEMHLSPNELESVHIEFDYRDRKRRKFFGDCLDISKHDDSFWLHPATKRDVIMKISFATEELYQLAHRKLKEE